MTAEELIERLKKVPSAYEVKFIEDDNRYMITSEDDSNIGTTINNIEVDYDDGVVYLWKGQVPWEN